MASDASPPGDDEVKVRRRRRREVQAVDIEELTSTGHRALQEGQTGCALSCFSGALKAARQVRSPAGEIDEVK